MISRPMIGRDIFATVWMETIPAHPENPGFIGH